MTKNIEIMSLPKKVENSEWKDDVANDTVIEESYKYFPEEEGYKLVKKINKEAVERVEDFQSKHKNFKSSLGKCTLDLFNVLDQAA